MAVGVALVLALASSGCGGGKDRDRDVVARIDAPGGPLELDRRVVDQLAANAAIEPAAAQARALDRLRWVAARRAEIEARETPPEHPDDLDPARRDHLERAALVRLWTREVFEPATTPAKIPDRVIEQNMADPRMTRPLFHPEVWFACQVLIVPKPAADGERGDPLPIEGEAAEIWQAEAEVGFAPMVARVQAVADDLVAEPDCATFAGIVEASETKFTGSSRDWIVRYERFAFAPEDAPNFDAGWVAAVTAEPGLHMVGPFASPFGLHLVVISRIEPASLAAGSLPPDELEVARRARLRDELAVPWRTDQLNRTLVDARSRRVVRLGAEIQ